MVFRHLVLILAVLSAACSTTFEPRTTPVFSTNEAAIVHPCASSARDRSMPCRLPVPMQVDVLERIVATSTPSVSGDTVTFAMKANSVTHITLVGGLRLPLERVHT